MRKGSPWQAYTLYLPIRPTNQRLSTCTLNVCDPRFWVPNAFIQGHTPWVGDTNARVQRNLLELSTRSVGWMMLHNVAVLYRLQGQSKWLFVVNILNPITTSPGLPFGASYSRGSVVYEGFKRSMRFG